uniref:Uncharacterized protein n=1 Tax=Arundo donax TaxID=35708 RepID=A0A0A9HK23_ARUDO
MPVQRSEPNLLAYPIREAVPILAPVFFLQGRGRFFSNLQSCTRISISDLQHRTQLALLRLARIFSFVPVSSQRSFLACTFSFASKPPVSSQCSWCNRSCICSSCVGC